MDIEKIAINFGIPGLLIAAIYLTVTTLGKMWVQSNERIQMERIKVEDKKADAMVSALASLASTVAAHHTADIQSHQALGEGIAAIDAKLDTIHGLTPVKGVPKVDPPPSEYGYHRPKTGGR